MELHCMDQVIVREKEGNCKFPHPGIQGDPNKTDKPDYNAWWVKKYCTMTTVDEFTLYFPYVLLIMPLIMVAVEKMFIKYAYFLSILNIALSM